MQFLVYTLIGCIHCLYLIGAKQYKCVGTVYPYFEPDPVPEGCKAYDSFKMYVFGALSLTCGSVFLVFVTIMFKNQFTFIIEATSSKLNFIKILTFI